MTTRVLQLTVAKLIAPFSPGAVVDILGESFMTMTADRWPKRTLLPQIDCLRLSNRLGVQKFYGPPVVPDLESPHALGINVARFPSWLFCQTCRRMTRWTSKDETGAPPTCPNDSGHLVPMRFVLVCREHSHASDVPWPEWLHRGPGADSACKDSFHLRFRAIEGGSPGLSGLEVVCDTCSRRRTLGDLRSDMLAREGLTCRGTQPWETDWRDCSSALEVVQRGATSFHYSETQAAIDIPIVDELQPDLEDRIQTHPLFMGLCEVIKSPNAPALAQMIAEDVKVSLDTVMRLALHSVGASEPSDREVRTSILAEEFAAFRAAADDRADEANFKTRAYEFSNSSTDPVERQLSNLIDGVVLVDRLREVRACIGFTRYRPDSERVNAVLNNGDEASWLPAYEGFGEGVFLRFNGRALDSWASQAEVIVRGGVLDSKLSESRFKNRLHSSSAQYVALHSFAHALLREFAFSSGYAAASLHERIYCESDGDYGVFIYTTSSDNEGTLGGLVREGELDRLASTLARAAEHLSWCSNDPVCKESHPQNLDGLNLAACHSCLLASETSCEGFNLLLDRLLLVGSGTMPGLLDPVIRAVAAM